MVNIIEIHDFSAPELDIYARWTENQLLNRKDPANAMFIAESQKVIQTALDAGYEPISCLVEKKHVGDRLLSYWLSAEIFRCIQLNLMC